MKTKRKSDWQKLPHESLRRYRPTGVYYLWKRAGGGRQLRQSLQTTDLDVARAKRDEALRTHRATARAGAPICREGLTFAEAVARLREQVQGGVPWSSKKAVLKPRSLRFNLELLDVLLRTWPNPELDLREITVADCRLWAARLRGRYGAVRYNASVGALRRVFALAIELHVRVDNPAAQIGKAKVEVRRSDLWLPEPAQLDALVAALRGQRGAANQDNADFALFLRWTGLRGFEAGHLPKSAVDLKSGLLWLPGSITKNGRSREVPIFPPARAIIERWLAAPNRRRGEYSRAPGSPRPDYLCPVWRLNGALKSVCAKLQFPVRLSHHDFRHLFITDLLKQGVEAAVIARWVGHGDNGKLIRETYTLVGEQWEREEIERVSAIYANP